MQRKIISVLTVLAVGVLFLSAGTLLTEKQDSPELTDARINLAMRSIGHQLLLNVGDFSSRVLPVKQINPYTFQLSFESRFAFVPDSLIAIVHRNITSAHLPQHYLVSVLNCQKDIEVVYGYEMLERSREKIACLGRTQAIGCYNIQIMFPDRDSMKASSKPYVWLAALSAMILVTFVGSSLRKKEKKEGKTDSPIITTSTTTTHEDPFISLGKYAFYDAHRRLKSEDESIELSDKESRLLKIFALHPNQTIDRERLLKEVWEDDGVFVGRSLDVFVSKLRKRLQNDASLRLVNVHGKGYKLETNISALV